MGLHRVRDIVDGEAVALHADAVDAGVGANAAGHLVQRLAHIDLAIVEDFGAELLRQLQPVRIMVDGDHPVRAHDQRGLDREQPDRTAAPDRDRVARLDLGILRCHPAGRQDV